MRALARELGDYGIHINAVASGFLANETGLALIGEIKANTMLSPTV